MKLIKSIEKKAKHAYDYNYEEKPMSSPKNIKIQEHYTNYENAVSPSKKDDFKERYQRFTQEKDKILQIIKSQTEDTLPATQKLPPQFVKPT